MKGRGAEVIAADVRGSDLLDRLVVTPRRIADGHALSGVLKHLLHGVRIHRSAEGVWVAAQDADLLLDVDATVDLHWSLDARLLAENRRRAKQAHQHLHREVNLIRSAGRIAAETYLADVQGLHVLDDHQWVNVAAMTLPRGYGLCVFDEQGAGKTVTCIFAFDVLVARDQVDFALIVAPKSMVPEWPLDFVRFKEDIYDVQVVAGSHQQKLTALGSGADVLVTNFETAVSLEPELKALLRQYQRRAVLVVDESFYIKSLMSGHIV
jgi:SNF2 family DNA or RNA helicase